MTENEDKEIILDTKIIHPGVLHGLIKNGGTIKFQNFPFGLKFVGSEYRVEIQLFAVPVGVKYTAHMNPHKKKEQIDIDIEEQETLVM